jgi:SAM-dependent methyltransferase
MIDSPRKAQLTTMDDETWIPEDVDPLKPSIARIYDFHLGGTHNLAADREAARTVTEVMPDFPDILRANRSFLRRCVRHLAEQGIAYFLDLGSGIPTVGNVHEIAQAVNPAARIVYIDNDPVAVAHSRKILAGNDRATVLQADLRDSKSVLADAEVRRLLLLDLEEPIAILLSAVLHFIPDDNEAADLVAAYRDALPSGSYLALSHGGQTTGSAKEAAAVYSRMVAPVKMRSREDIAALLTGFELVDPGVVFCSQWKPDGRDEDGSRSQPLPQICALARKP